MQKIDWSILRRSVNGDLTEKEKQEVEAWRNESGENERYYQKMKNFFTQEKSKEVDVRKNLKKFEQRTYGKQRKIFIGLCKYVAVFICLVGTIVLWQKFDTVQPEVNSLALAPGKDQAVLYTGSGKAIVLESRLRTNIVISDSLFVQQDSNVLNYEGIEAKGKMVDEFHLMRVPRGGEFSMKLSDGTMVHLNAETDLRYPVRFSGEERRVVLSGEAFFDVAKSGTPFIIELNGFEVKVLGTRFNINAYEGESRFETTLERGSVEINVKGKTLLLEPGEQAVLTNTGELSKQKVDVSLYTAWKDGYFVFEDERLEDVMNTVARWYDVNLFYQNPGVKEIRINGNISRYKDFSVLLEKIEKLDIVHFDIKGNNITVIDK